MSMVRSPAKRPETDIFEVLSAMTAACGLGRAPEELRNVKVAMPDARLRLTLRTLLENAAKAHAKAGGPVLMRTLVEKDSVILILDAPYLAPGDYPVGMGIGVESVTSDPP